MICMSSECIFIHVMRLANCPTRYTISYKNVYKMYTFLVRKILQITGIRFPYAIPSLLVSPGFWPLDLRCQSSLLWCWFRIHRLPESVPCVSIERDSHSQLYTNRPSLPKPFGLRVASAMTVNWPFNSCLPLSITSGWLLAVSQSIGVFTHYRKQKGFTGTCNPSSVFRTLFHPHQFPSMFLLMVLNVMLVLGMVLYSPPSLAEVACLQ